jgi:GNAT superfamily N-acetyltransferase
VIGADVQIRPLKMGDFEPWLALWRSYCAALGGNVPDEATLGLWRRLMAPKEAVRCLVAARPDEPPIAFAVYVLHPNTWTLTPVCYLEDLFVAEAERGKRIGQRLIEALIALGKEQGWRRLYWHTRESNRDARALYDRLVQRTDYIRYDVEL